MDSVKERWQHGVKGLPESCVCGKCSAVIAIDWTKAEHFKGGNLLHFTKCPSCNANVVNALGSSLFTRFVAQHVR